MCHTIQKRIINTTITTLSFSTAKWKKCISITFVVMLTLLVSLLLLSICYLATVSSLLFVLIFCSEDLAFYVFCLLSSFPSSFLPFYSRWLTKVINLVIGCSLMRYFSPSPFHSHTPFWWVKPRPRLWLWMWGLQFEWQGQSSPSVNMRGYASPLLLLCC